MATLLGCLVPNGVTRAAGASLFISPSQGQYEVNGTFQLSLMLNTGGQAVNTVNAQVTFPADKLQVVNPTVSESFIQVWTSGPSFSNTNGTLNFQGGLPTPGINTSAGVISTIQFRAKSAGKATIAFTDESKVLANDGAGTNILTSKSSATLTINLAAPAGPKISSPTHEDQNKWYKSRSVILQWETSGNEKEFSYLLDTVASSIPEPKTNSTALEHSQTVEADGIWYFHLRAKNSGGWGGTSHYSLKIDGTGPAAFTPILERRSFAESSHELVTFTTTDATSGIDHYEIRIVSRNNPEDATSFFTEQQSPYQLPTLPTGDYTLIVRAVDAAGNATDGTADFSVVDGAAALAVGQPLFGNPLVTNVLLVLMGLLLLIFFTYWLHHRHQDKSLSRLRSELIGLRTNVAERQNELHGLADLQQRSTAELQSLTAPTPPPAPSPTIQAPIDAINSPSPESTNSGQISPGQ